MSNQVFSKFDIETMYAMDTNDITFDCRLKYAIIGDDVDDRCNTSIEYLSTKYEIVKIGYDASNFTIKFDKQVIDADVFPDFLKERKYKDYEVLIDCTTVNVPELLLLIGALLSNNVLHFSALYIEPQNYSHSQRIEFGDERKFELSNRYIGYKGIPGYLLSIESGDSVAFCCGYEPERIMNAFEDESISGNSSNLIFGMPPFNAGWDMNAYENHMNFIESQSIRNIYYCGATNPLSVIKRLDEMYAAIGEDEKLFVAPLGTKPMSLGACLFIVANGDREKVAILFDHPIKKKGRSSHIGKWHLYNINLL